MQMNQAPKSKVWSPSATLQARSSIEARVSALTAIRSKTFAPDEMTELTEDIYDIAMNAARAAFASTCEPQPAAEGKRAEAAIRTLERLGYSHTGGAEWRPSLGPAAQIGPDDTVERRGG